MKIGKSISSVLVLAVVAFSCNPQDNVIHVDMSKIANNLQGEYIKSYITLTSTENNEFFLLSKKDGEQSYSKAGILQTDKVTRLSLNGQMEWVKLPFGMLIKQDNEVYYFGLADERGKQQLAQVEEMIKQKVSHIYYGYGLNYTTGKWDASINLNSKSSAFSIVGRTAPDGEVDFKDPCTSGGAGSSSCSIGESPIVGGGSCSVTCVGNYYACCDSSTVKCNCKQNPA